MKYPSIYKILVQKNYIDNIKQGTSGLSLSNASGLQHLQNWLISQYVYFRFCKINISVAYFMLLIRNV